MIWAHFLIWLWVLKEQHSRYRHSSLYQPRRVFPFLFFFAYFYLTHVASKKCTGRQRLFVKMVHFSYSSTLVSAHCVTCHLKGLQVFICTLLVEKDKVRIKNSRVKYPHLNYCLSFMFWVWHNTHFYVSEILILHQHALSLGTLRSHDILI